MKPFDTSFEAEKIQIDIFKAMKPEDRLQKAVDLMQMSRKLMMEGVRRRHPEYNEDQIRLAFIRLVIGDDLFFRVYPAAKDILP